MYLLSTAYMSRVDTGSVRVPAFPEYGQDFDTAISAEDFFAGCIRGVGQIFLCDNIASGFLVLAGIAVCSRISALSALAGSVLGSAIAVASGVPGAAVTAGMFGFNSSLTVTAIFMFYTPGFGALLLATLAGIMTCLGQQALASYLEPYGLPFITLPFCLVCLPFVILQGTTSLVIPVPLASMTVPEDHLRKVAYLSDGFRFLMEALNPDNAKQFKRMHKQSSLKRSLKRISTILEKKEEEEKAKQKQEHDLSASLRQSRKLEDAPSIDKSQNCLTFLVDRFKGRAKLEGWVLKAAPRIFKELDSKRQGFITPAEFSNALRTVGLDDQIGLRFATLVFHMMDADESGTIDRKEFVILCQVSVELLTVRSTVSKFFDFVDIGKHICVLYYERMHCSQLTILLIQTAMNLLILMKLIWLWIIWASPLSRRRTSILFFPS